MPLPLFVFTHSNTARDTRNDWFVQTMRMMEAVEGLIEDLILRRTQDWPCTHWMSTTRTFFCVASGTPCRQGWWTRLLLDLFEPHYYYIFSIPLIQSMRTLEMNLCVCFEHTHTHTHTHTHSDMSRYQSAKEKRMSLRMRSSMLTYADVCWRMLA
jgi:hypothetical protein